MSHNESDDLAKGLQAATDSLREQRADPYLYSGLVQWLELDTWRTEDALCLLADINPTGAEIRPNYENFQGVKIHEPVVVNAELLTEPDGFYLLPCDPDPDDEVEALTPSERAEVVEKRAKLRQATLRYRKICRLWYSDPTHDFLSRDTPAAYLDWATRKRIPVGWRDWYNAQDFGIPRSTQHQPLPTASLAPRAETTYLNIIGGLLKLMLSESPAGRKQSVFDSQAAVAQALLVTFAGKPGIAERTLQEKFAAANRSIEGG